MENSFKSMDLEKVQHDIRSSHESLGQVRSMQYAKNLTANHDLKDVRAVGDKIVVSLKAWPAQSVSGIFMPESYVIIRGGLYITEVEDVGEDVTIVSKGDAVVVSMYSGYHVTTKTGHVKIISEGDILIHKKAAVMKAHPSFDPTSFEPGVNYILVELVEKQTIKSESGIIIEAGEDDAFNKNDVVTKTAKVVAIGTVNEYGKKYANVKVGSLIILDAYVGLEMNTNDTTDSGKFRVMLSNDVLGIIQQ